MSMEVEGISDEEGNEREGIDHFTVVSSMTWPLNGSEAGVDLVLIQISLLLSCKTTYLA